MFIMLILCVSDSFLVSQVEYSEIDCHCNVWWKRGVKLWLEYVEAESGLLCPWCLLWSDFAFIIWKFFCTSIIWFIEYVRCNGRNNSWSLMDVIYCELMMAVCSGFTVKLAHVRTLVKTPSRDHCSSSFYRRNRKLSHYGFFCWIVSSTDHDTNTWWKLFSVPLPELGIMFHAVCRELRGNANEWPYRHHVATKVCAAELHLKICVMARMEAKAIYIENAILWMFMR